MSAPLTEQVSHTIRTVAVHNVEVKEYFMGFLESEESTGEGLSSLILNRLQDLNISFEDCRGQSYDNGANMDGKKKGVQARLLEINPKAFFVPCATHSLNLVVADAGKSSPEAAAYYGYLQKLFTLFSASTQCWSILKSHVNLTLKSWTETRWESRVKSLEAVRYQAAEVRDALLEKANDPVVKIEAHTLAEEVGSYRFAICTVVWYDILIQIHHVSKLMQSESMQLDVAVSLLMKTEASLKSYRKTGFASAQATAGEICEKMNVEAVLKHKILRKTKHLFSYESHDEPFNDAMKQMEVCFFNNVVDVCIESLHERFETLSKVESKSSQAFPKLSTLEICQQCATLSDALTSNGQSDLNGKELALEMQNFPDFPQEHHDNTGTFVLHRRKETEGNFPQYVGSSPNCCNFSCKCG